MIWRMNIKISCIVPSYNEGKRVSAVLDALALHELIDEVIVVNDGSTDDSEKILKEKKGFTLVSYEKNVGKTLALKKGLEVARNPWVMTIDADLVGLKKEDITALIEPVMNGRADVTLSLRANSLLVFKLFGLDFVSGERLFEKKLIDLEYLHKLPRFGFEAYLNDIILQKKMRLGSVKWKNVKQTRKLQKIGYLRGFAGEFKTFLDVLAVLKIRGLLRQFCGMYKSKCK